jgi:hypothetical protein
MPDRSSAPHPDAVRDDPLLPDDDWEPGADDPMVPSGRRRHRLVKPLTVALTGLMLATAGFIAGVQVQKRQKDGGSATAVARPGGFPGAGGATGGAGSANGGAAQEQPTVGTVANKKGGTLYVESVDRATIRVKTNAQSKVTRNAASSPRGIYPGDTVVVQGTKNEDGSVVATQITATSATAAASGGGIPGGGQPPTSVPGG